MTFEPPDTRFARIGDDRIAYQVVGAGPPDVVYTSGVFGNVDGRWDHPDYSETYRRFARFSRLIMFDPRGTGASDALPPGTAHGWESWVEDLKAVMAAAGSRSAAMIAFWDAVPSAILLAATEPEKVLALVLGSATARYVRAPDYPFGFPAEEKDARVAAMRELYGTEAFGALAYPSRATDPAFLEWFARYQRSCVRPAEFADHLRQMFDLDVRPALPLVSAPTLVIATESEQLPLDHSRYIADNVLDGRLTVFPTKDTTPVLDSSEEFVGVIEEFLTGSRRQAVPSRRLATVVFTDIVGSTKRAAEIGDARWRRLLDSHDAVVRQTVERFGGRVVNTTGDGALATFEGPARAATCAARLRDALQQQGLEIRTGLHVGEVEIRGENIGGLAVHIAARVMAEARPGEILASSTVKDLVVGSGIGFTDRGVRALKGIPDEWRLYAVESV